MASHAMTAAPLLLNTSVSTMSEYHDGMGGGRADGEDRRDVGNCQAHEGMWVVSRCLCLCAYVLYSFGNYFHHISIYLLLLLLLL